ncbi:glycosyltransferase family 2 protein [Salegentibacter sp. BDJ18]|uniref:glycosyltransferase family 2 protein n=1 Tax=Salegentibacter sp. BDJ18 TaxID=2816376 RepID=UPI001AAFBB81|nr:glycosyltransferase family 2 protein [Salegentibacter sp. BDJ18]MBO2544276.1 glycosyltransferase family 2 protein [Salegentibacter sp. BDJ18]
MKSNLDFCISVIIPVYNAELYIEKAIDSAVAQPEVNEVIIVEDGSKDNSLEICKKIELYNKKVQVWQHEDKKNHGRSASKNLGISKANSPFIAFLDADDYFLPNRFKWDIIRFLEDSNTDGVYNAIGAKFYRKANVGEEEKFKLTTITAPIQPELLFRLMYPIGHLGYFSGIGLTVKKSLLHKTGYFNESLVVAEDTELWVKMALMGKLVAGQILEPVAIRGIHDDNVSFKKESLYKIYNQKMFENLLTWSFLNQIPAIKRKILWERSCRTKKAISSSSELTAFILKKLIKYPELLLSKDTYRYLPVLRRLKEYIS